MPKLTIRPRPLIGLAAGAALALAAGQALAREKPHDPHDTIRQAAEDARAAAKAADKAGDDAERARRDVRIYRRADGRDALAVHGGADRSDRLRTLLQLRPEQESALKAYSEAVGAGGARDQVVRVDRGGEGKTTTERLADMEVRLVEQQDAMKRRIAATRTFYAQLDERQRKVFDAMPMLMFAGPGFGPMLVPVAHTARPPAPPEPPAPPRSPRS